MKIIRKYLSLVKFAHTLFAMPFALLGFCLGYLEISRFEWKAFLLVILSMVFARNAAMGFNRYLDRNIDAENDRTSIREIPSGKISARNALLFVLVNTVLFIMTTFFINWICFFLSPVALLVILGYSYTKRFTALCHLVLGIGLGLAPVGAYLAVTGYFSLLPILLGIVVMTWVGGFDIIYALQDEKFDQEKGLNSIPAWLGAKRALWVSTSLHVVTALALISFALMAEVALFAWLGVAGFIGLLIYQHLLVKPSDLSRVNLAFFTTNGIAALLFACCVSLDLLLDFI